MEIEVEGAEETVQMSNEACRRVKSDAMGRVKDLWAGFALLQTRM